MQTRLRSLSPYVTQLLDGSNKLPEQEQLNLIILAQAGCGKSRNILVKSHAKFVYKAACTKDGYPNIEFDDLFNEGMIGLNKAIDRFAVGVKNKFMSYAVWWIKEHMDKFIRDYGNNVKIPTTIPNKERTPQIHLSFDFKHEDSSMSIGDRLQQEVFLSPEDEQFSRRMSEVVEAIFSDLDDEEKIILKNYFGFYGEKISTSELGQRFNMRKENMRLKKDRLLKKIQTDRNIKIVKDLLLQCS